MVASIKENEQAIKDAVKVFETIPQPKNKKKEKGSNITPKIHRAMPRGSECFITFQRQLKQAARKWERELAQSKGEVK